MLKMVSVSEEATRRRLEKQHREQMDALRKQLDTAENRLRESLILKKTLYQDYESQGKELKLQQRKNHDIMEDNKKLQNKLDAMIRLGGSVNVTHDKESVTPLPSSVATLTQQMKRAKESLLKYEQQCDIYREREAEFVERINSLEESLLHTKRFGDSAGPSSSISATASADSSEHVELLSKMAAMRGEVAAMRTELEHKTRKLNEVEERKNRLAGNHDQMQYHIDAIQQKLVKSEEENTRLSDSASLLSALTKVTSERDMLLEYIQTNKLANSDATERLRDVETQLAEVLCQEALLKQRNAQLEAMLDCHSTQNKMDEVYQIKSAGLSQTIDQLQRDHGELQRKYDRKTLEADELTKMQISLLSQLKQKENTDRDLSEEWTVMKSRNKELELTNVVLIDDNEGIRSKMAKLSEEMEYLKSCVQSGSDSSSRLYTLEPECISLRAEKTQWLLEKAELMEELTPLRALEESLLRIKDTVVTADVGSASVYIADPTDESPLRDSSAGAVKFASSCHSDLDLTSQSQSLSASALGSVGITQQLEVQLLSHSHATWANAACLSALSPELATRILSLYKDLLAQEERNIQVVHTVVNTRVELEALKSQYNAEIGRLLPKEAEMDSLIEQFKSRREETSTETMKNTSARTSMDQIRMVLKSTPGGVSDIIASVVGASQPQSHTGSARTTPARGSRLDPSDLYRSPKPNSETAPAHNQYSDHVTSSLIDNLRLVSAGVQQSPAGGIGTGAGRGINYPQYDIADVPDQQIPDLIGRIITRNANCVSGLNECLGLYDKLFGDFEALQGEYTAIVDEKDNLQKVIIDIRDHQEKAEESHQAKDQTLVLELNSATELVEKQNALIITLEAKIANIKRDKQLRNAQVFTFIQREEHSRLLMWSLLEQFMTRTDLTDSVHLPAKTIKLAGRISPHVVLP